MSSYLCLRQLFYFNVENGFGGGGKLEQKKTTQEDCAPSWCKNSGRLQYYSLSEMEGSEQKFIKQSLQIE